MRFYLDEMFPPLLAAMLRARGLDAVSALEQTGSATPDEVHLMLAARQGRCIVTKDIHDFRDLTFRFLEHGYPHAGIVLVPRTVASEDFATLVARLSTLAALYPEGVPPYTLLWLPPLPPS